MGLLKFGEATFVYTGESEGASGFKFGPESEKEFLSFGLAFEMFGGPSECRGS
jgi:hypothetical protein